MIYDESKNEHNKYFRYVYGKDGELDSELDDTSNMHMAELAQLAELDAAHSSHFSPPLPPGVSKPASFHPFLFTLREAYTVLIIGVLIGLFGGILLSWWWRPF